MVQTGADRSCDDREAQTRRHILAAATLTFERLGLRRATMEGIAKAAGVSRKTIYNHFDSKPKLIGEVIEGESLRAAVDARRQLDMTAPPEELIVEAEMALLYTARKSRYANMMIRPDAQAISVTVLEQSERIARVEQQFWAPILEPLREAGRLRVDDLGEVVEWLTLIHFVLLARRPIFTGSPDVTRRLLRTYVVPSILLPPKQQHA